MFRKLARLLGQDEIDDLVKSVRTLSEDGADITDLRPAIERLVAIQPHQRDAAEGLIWLVYQGHVPRPLAGEVVSEVFSSYAGDLDMLMKISTALEDVRDIDDLNAAPPEGELFASLLATYNRLRTEYAGTPDEHRIAKAQAVTARLMARQHDETATSAAEWLIANEPENAGHHYTLGLLHKTRGRFAEGLAANRRAIELSSSPTEAMQWNFGICATGAGEGQVALELWQSLGNKIEMGRFGLPEGRYPQCKVKLAQRPLAERTVTNDDPGLEESIWVQRLSPCHGIVRSVLYQDLGVDYGDVVLFDGAPVTMHTYGDRQIPVFPHLATLLHNNYQFFDFAGTQGEAGQLNALSEVLSEDAVIYPHTEFYREICQTCFRDPGVDHEDHHAADAHIVSGRIAAPPDILPQQLLSELDAAMAQSDDCQIYCPQLCRAVNNPARAETEHRRYQMLNEN